MKTATALSLLFLFALLSCTDSAKEEQLNLREKTLSEKEQLFAAKEQDYEKLKMLRDSLQAVPDSTATVRFSKSFLGRYNGKMICTDSNCSENAVGDLRSDVWEILEDGVKITNKNGNEKFYKGQFNNNELKLINEEAAPALISEITLNFSDSLTSRIKGNRLLKRENCISKFSVELEKLKN